MKGTLAVAGNPGADELINTDPLALLLGMMLDQQIPMEKAFSGPWALRERLGHDLDAGEIAAYDPEDFAALVARPPAIHRFPASMAKRLQALCGVVVDRYDGDAEAIWAGVNNAGEVLARLKALPGFGEQKAQIFLALLGKRLGVRPRGWRAAAGVYGQDKVHRSVADVTGPEALGRVRAYKQEVKAAAKAGAGAARPA